MRLFKIEKGTTLLEFLQMKSWFSDISQNKIGYFIAANFNLITEDGQENLYWIEDEFSHLAPDQYEELKSKLNKMKNKEVVESILNSYAETKKMDNWNELIGHCNNNPEEIAAHYEMAMDKYISEQKKAVKNLRINKEALRRITLNGMNPTEEELTKAFTDSGVILIDESVEIEASKFIKGQWYTHTEPGQEKFLIRVEDPEKQICSGWDCKGNPFKNEWVHLGNRLLLKTKNLDHVQTINEIFESNFK